MLIVASVFIFVTIFFKHALIKDPLSLDTLRVWYPGHHTVPFQVSPNTQLPTSPKRGLNSYAGKTLIAQPGMQTQTHRFITCANY